MSQPVLRAALHNGLGAVNLREPNLLLGSHVTGFLEARTMAEQTLVALL
jgi:hypothetical protein